MSSSQLVMEQSNIKAIDKVSVAKICSGQVIQDLATAVKELVENSLDAGAKHVEIKLKEFGLDLIEVSDNGSGISPSNYEGLALKYHTSKLSSFSDLSGVTSFGFRGEALSSLCELAGAFTVTTRTVNESVGIKLSYRRDGKLIKKETAPRQVGTTISISNMFEPLPVRRGEYQRNIKKQYNRLLRGMQAYALISLGVRLTLTNTRSKGGKKIEIATQYNNKLEDNVNNVFGPKFLSTLMPFRVDLGTGGGNEEASDSATTEVEGDGVVPSASEVHDGSTQAKEDGAKSERKVWGMVSKAGEGVGRADNDRQFIYVNGRPVDLPKFTRAVNEVWRTYEMKQKPAFIIDLRIPPGTFDVNVTPDKREIFLIDEAHIVDAMKKSLDAIWTPSRYTMPVNQGQLVQARLTNEAFSMTTPRVTSLAEAALPAAPRVDPVSLKALSRDIAAGEAGLPGTNPTDVAPRDRRAGGREANSVDDECSLLSGAVASGGGDGKSVKQPSERSEEADCKKGRPRGDSKGAANMLGASQGTKPSLSPSNVSVPHGGDGKVSSRNPPKRPRRGERYGLGDEESGESPRPRQDVHVEERALNGNRQRTDVLGDDDDVLGQFGGARTHTNKAKERLRVSDTLGKGNRESTSKEGVSDGADGTSSKGVDTGGDGAGANGRLGDTLAFDLTAILAGSRSASRRKRKRDHRNASAYSFSGSLSGGASAEEADSKAAARVFSRVLHKEHFTKMRVVGQFNLGFIICLLGSDLFILDQHACDEKYNFEVLQQTTTIHQQPLVRPLPLETTASEEMTIMDNLAIFEKNGFRFRVREDQPTTRKLEITSVPFSKGTQFGADDVHELASIVANNPREMVRLPKARAMFASRACRSSIMIGKALDKAQMARVVAKMATIEQPWNCPHGRPTMRHLADVSKSLRAAAGLDALLEK